MLDGAAWAQRRLEDLAGFVALHVLIAAGVTYPETPTPAKATAPTFERVMGRPPTPFLDPPEKTAEQIAEEEDARRQAAARLALAQMQVYEAQMRRDRPGMVVDSTATPEHEEHGSERAD